MTDNYALPKIFEAVKLPYQAFAIFESTDHNGYYRHFHGSMDSFNFDC